MVFAATTQQIHPTLYLSLYVTLFLPHNRTLLLIIISICGGGMKSRSSRQKGWLAHYTELISSWAKKHPHSPDAEDAVQDVAVNMIQMEHSAVDYMRAYLFRSAINGVNRQHIERQKVSLLSLDELKEAEHPLVSHVETDAYASELTQRVQQALAELPLKQQQVFAWHRLEGWTVPEIAAHMQLSVSSVEKYLSAALRHLQHRLRE